MEKYSTDNFIVTQQTLKLEKKTFLR